MPISHDAVILLAGRAIFGVGQILVEHGAIIQVFRKEGVKALFALTITAEEHQITITDDADVIAHPTTFLGIPPPSEDGTANLLEKSVDRRDNQGGGGLDW